jgi:hypothetical protein
MSGRPAGGTKREGKLGGDWDIGGDGKKDWRSVGLWHGLKVAR